MNVSNVQLIMLKNSDENMLYIYDLIITPEVYSRLFFQNKNVLNVCFGIHLLYELSHINILGMSKTNAH